MCSVSTFIIPLSGPPIEFVWAWAVLGSHADQLQKEYLFLLTEKYNLRTVGKEMNELIEWKEFIMKCSQFHFQPTHYQQQQACLSSVLTSTKGGIFRQPKLQH
jgi:hypothetical protein